MARRVLGWALLFGLAVAWIVVLVEEANGTGSTENQDAFGHLTALVVLALFTLILQALSRRVSGLLIGKDNRVSTSKVQVLVWTYAIAGAMLSLIAATWVGPDRGFDALTDPAFDFEPYLVLLGGPFAAAILARAIVGSQVANGESPKPPGQPEGSQVFTDDTGKADLIDSQYLLFNLVALIYFLGAFVQAPSEGLPDIPTILYVLTGASAATYVSSKAVTAAAPQITSIYPSQGPAGTPIEIFGGSLLFPKDDVAEVVDGSEADFLVVRVRIGQREAAVVANSLSHSSSGDDRLKAVVPPTLTASSVDVEVLNFRGVASNKVQFEVT